MWGGGPGAAPSLGSGLLLPLSPGPLEEWGVRPILDLRVLNGYVAIRRSCMLWLGASLRVCERHRKFLKLPSGTVVSVQRLPFGYSLAPYTLSKCVEAAPERLRR